MRYIKFKKEELEKLYRTPYSKIDDLVDEVIEARKQSRLKRIQNLWQYSPIAKHPTQSRNRLRDQLIVLEVNQRATRGNTMKLYDELAASYGLCGRSIRHIIRRMKKNPT